MTLRKKSRQPTHDDRVVLDFEDNSLLPLLFGQHDAHLARIEQMLGVVIISRGNRLRVEGADNGCQIAETTLRDLYKRLEAGQGLEVGDVEGAIRLASDDLENGSSNLEELNGGVQINTKSRIVKPRTPMQAQYIRHLMGSDITFGVGPAGTGKTYLAVAAAVAKLMSGEVERIILSRPAVEAGENLGFLPGDMKDKVDPYLRPLYDALYDTMPVDQVEKRLANGQIEIAPLAFMRGRTLSNAYVILDEAQNTTFMQMKMFLTRFGMSSQMVIAGDPSQVDLPGDAKSGLWHALQILKELSDVAVVRFSDRDVVRHQLVSQIVKAYEKRSAKS